MGKNIRKSRAIGNGAFRTVTLGFAAGVEPGAVREREREFVEADIAVQGSPGGSDAEG
jgi:hypothetical protein